MLSILFTTAEGYKPLSLCLPGTWFVQILWLTCLRSLRSTAAAWKKGTSPALTPDRTPSSDPCTGPAFVIHFSDAWVWVHPYRSSPKLDTVFKLQYYECSLLVRWHYHPFYCGTVKTNSVNICKVVDKLVNSANLRDLELGLSLLQRCLCSEWNLQASESESQKLCLLQKRLASNNKNINSSIRAQTLQTTAYYLCALKQ